MSRRFSRKRKAVSAVVSALLVATTFSPGGCMVKVDESTLQDLFGLVQSVNTQGEFGFNGSWESSSGDWSSERTGFEEEWEDEFVGQCDLDHDDEPDHD